jgi:hypothetical protein
MELLVEGLGEAEPAGPTQPLQLTQNGSGAQPR